MVPEPLKYLEIAAAVFILAVGPPERDGLAHEGLDANEVARFAGGADVGARVVPRLHGHAKAQDLDLAAVDGGQGAGGAEERDDVCAACYGAEVEVGAEGAVDVGEGGGGEGGAGRVDCAEGGEGEDVWGLAGKEGFAFEDREVLC